MCVMIMIAILPPGDQTLRVISHRHWKIVHILYKLFGINMQSILIHPEIVTFGSEIASNSCTSPTKFAAQSIFSGGMYRLYG